MKRVFPVLFLTALLATACAPTLATRGNFVDPDDMATLTVGKSSKEDVRTVIGSPTTVEPLDDSTWYYIGQKTERKGFHAEKVTARRVVEVKFDDQGLLQSVKPMENGGRAITMNKDVTPTSGHNLTFSQQLFGNLGRFNSKSAAKGAPTVGPENPVNN